MDTALPQKFPFILDRNLAKANCTENQVCTSCDIVQHINFSLTFDVLRHQLRNLKKKIVHILPFLDVLKGVFRLQVSGSN